MMWTTTTWLLTLTDEVLEGEAALLIMLVMLMLTTRGEGSLVEKMIVMNGGRLRAERAVWWRR